MTATHPIHHSPIAYLMAEQPDEPVLFLSPAVLQETAQRFLKGFPGFVTYAVKANSSDAVIGNLVAAGLRGFDVASPAEIALVRDLAPDAALHYNNPVRSMTELEMAVAHNVASYAVDDPGELHKLSRAGVPEGTEVAVRFKLPVSGAAYDFGEKFGATPDQAVNLLRASTHAGYRPALTFHPGTQCTDPAAWDSYITAAAGIAHKAGVILDRLNVGGGFPARRMQADTPPLETIFATIADSTARVFGKSAPALVCEPGRAMVAEAVTLAVRVKSLRGADEVYLNDGIYGALAEQPIIGATDRIDAVASDGRLRRGAPAPRRVWGPTCDSLDHLPGRIDLPGDLEEGDYLLFHGMGAYSTATLTRFNGYGGLRMATVLELGSH